MLHYMCQAISCKLLFIFNEVVRFRVIERFYFLNELNACLNDLVFQKVNKFKK